MPLFCACIVPVSVPTWPVWHLFLYQLICACDTSCCVYVKAHSDTGSQINQYRYQ